MILALLVSGLFAQSAIELPLKGLVRTPQGWYELYGIRGNLLAGAKLPEDVVTAAAFDGVRVWKTEAELVAHARGVTHRIGAPEGGASFAWNGSAVFALVAGDLYRWKPAEGWRTLGALGSEREALGLAADAQQLTVLTRRRLVRYRLDGTFLEERDGNGEDTAALGSDGVVWNWQGTELHRGDRSWTFPGAIASVQALDGGWMIVTHGEHQSMVHADFEEAAGLPAP